MIEVRRLLAVGAALSLAAVLTCAHVWGGPGQGKRIEPWRPGDGRNLTPDERNRQFADDLVGSRFADQPLVLYQGDKGDAAFALQVKPQLADAPARPRDYLVLVDTSASKAQGPLAAAQQIAARLADRLGAGDRLALWTVNLEPKDLSRGFKARPDLDDALKDLAREFPAGAVNLKKALTRALDSFDGQAGRQRV